VWETGTGDLAAHLLPESSSAMATFSPDGELMTVVDFDSVRVLRTGSWDLVREFPREGPRRPGIPAAFSDDGSLMAIGITQTRVRLLRVDDWSMLADLEPANPYMLFHMTFLDHGRRLAVATPSQRLLIWDLETVWNELTRRGLVDPGDVPWR